MIAYINHKFSGSKMAFQVLYIDDMLIATNTIGKLKCNQEIYTKNFEMKDLGEALLCVTDSDLRGAKTQVDQLFVKFIY